MDWNKFFGSKVAEHAEGIKPDPKLGNNYQAIIQTLFDHITCDIVLFQMEVGDFQGYTKAEEMLLEYFEQHLNPTQVSLLSEVVNHGR